MNTCYSTNIPADVKSRVVIAEVDLKSTRAAGLQAYDVIVEMDGLKVKALQEPT